MYEILDLILTYQTIFFKQCRHNGQRFHTTERACAVAIIADVSFKTALAADFKREYKNIEFLWKQSPGVGGMIALPPVASQITGKYLCFLVTKATDKQNVNPESLVLALT